MGTIETLESKQIASCLRMSPRPATFTLGEGNTPLILSKTDDSRSVFLKVETGNPTGSYKDRGSALVVAAALREGAKRLAIASTGNAGASLAAYAASKGLDLEVVVPKDVSEGKLRKLVFFGARIRKAYGDFTVAEREYEALVRNGCYPAGPENPSRIEGIESMAFEIAEQLHPLECDAVFVPIGTGGLITALYKGFSKLTEEGHIHRLPRIHGVQLESVAPLSKQLEMDSPPPVRPSVADGINIAKSVLGKEALRAIGSTGGRLHRVSDKAIIHAQFQLARKSGVGAEPTGAVAAAAYFNAVESGGIARGENVVIPITGHMLNAGLLVRPPGQDAA